MKRITNFTFNDIVLYSKGWYERKFICEDLDYLFLKIYGWTTPNEREVAHRMMRVLDCLYKAAEVTIDDCPRGWLMSHTAFDEEVTKRRLLYPGCTRDMAIIYTVMSILQGLTKDEIKLNPPHFGKKEHFRMGMLIGEWPKSMTYTEMNRRAQKAFGV